MTMRETDPFRDESPAGAAAFRAEGGDPEELSEEALDGVAGGGDMPPPDPIDPVEEPEQLPPSSDDPALGDPSDPALLPPPEEDPLKTK